MLPPDLVAFVDFEASSLRHGFPIEVGVAWCDANNVYAIGQIISPKPEWNSPPFVWDQSAERLHGLSRICIQEKGGSADQVCKLLGRTLNGKTAFFDTGPDGLDRHWLDTLYRGTGQDRAFLIGGTSNDLLSAKAASNGIGPEQLALLRKSAPARTHEAVQDALHYAWIYSAIQLIRTADWEPEQELSDALLDNLRRSITSFVSSGR